MQISQHVNWLKTSKAHLETLRYADNVMGDIKTGKLSVYAAASNNVSRYALAEAFNLNGKPESLIEQSIIVLVPERMRASRN